jgi:hypothetical protein
VQCPTLRIEHIHLFKMIRAQKNQISGEVTDLNDGTSSSSLIVRQPTFAANCRRDSDVSFLYNDHFSANRGVKLNTSNVSIVRAPPGVLFDKMKKPFLSRPPARTKSVVKKLTDESFQYDFDSTIDQPHSQRANSIVPWKEFQSPQREKYRQRHETNFVPEHELSTRYNDAQQELTNAPDVNGGYSSRWALHDHDKIARSLLKVDSLAVNPPILVNEPTVTNESSLTVWSPTTEDKNHAESQLIRWQEVQQDHSITSPVRENALSVWQPQYIPDLTAAVKHDEIVKCAPDIEHGDDSSLSKQSAHDSVGKNSSHGSTCSMSDLESQDDDASYKAPGGNEMLIHIYFKTWTIATIIMLLINCANMDWVYLFKNEPWWMICLSIFFFGIQGILQWSVLELPLMSFASAFVKAETDRMADGRHLTIIINYNLLASYKSEVDATLVNAFSAYIGNLSPTVASVLVSATGDAELKVYELMVRDNLREQIYDLVLSEGKAWANGKILDEGRANRVFEPFRDRMGIIDENFVQLILPSLATKYAKDFMVIQRVTRVLRKCGQYQDLMLLSEGDNSAWTYTDKAYYKEAAREYGEPLFHISEDVENIQGRRFDYTLVLDGDTGVIKNSISTLLDVAAANPERAIVQPAIKIVAKQDQSLFMHIDKMRQEINEPITAALTTLLGRSGFYGKGLIQNKYYIKALLGTRDNPIEKVPIDVLSHDTFEAGALSPLYVSCVQLLEEPCGNYVTWDIRECRWNRGELLLAHYFFPHSLGRAFEWMMCRVRKTPPTKLILRYETHLDDAGAYIAHSALRQMMLKPLLLFYIVCRVWVKVYFFFNWLPLVLMVLLVLIMPKIPLTTRHNWHKVLADIMCCILQYSPEPITGTIRVFKSAKAHISGVSGWVPQFKVEQDFLIQPAVVATFAYQWRLFLLTCASLAPIIIFRPKDYLLMFLFAVTAFIPIYTTLTALPFSSWKRVIQGIKFYLCCAFVKKHNEQRKRKFSRNQHQQQQRHFSRRRSSMESQQRGDDDDSSVVSNASSSSNKSFYSTFTTNVRAD